MNLYNILNIINWILYMTIWYGRDDIDTEDDK
jgi:hypothetical protein